MPIAPGETFGTYRVIEPLGRGGMASVYKVYEAALDRYVALKVLPGEFLHDETFAERFKREAKVIARLEHPNVIPIHAFGIEAGIPWMAMRLISGGALSSLLRGGPLGHDRIITILRGAADALDYAHGKGVVHRDVKPQNILLDEAERVYLADFGIAKMVEGSGALTQTGMITGTPQYMAPEQATGQPVDQRVDIYALGVVAYEMLTGRVPFAADTPVAVLMKHVTEPIPIPPPSTVPEPLVRALLKSMAKKPEDRWPTAGAFVRALEQGLAEVPTASIPAATATVAAAQRPAPTMPPPGPTTRRTPAPARTGGLGLGLVIGVMAAVAVLAVVVVLAVARSRSAPKTTASLSSSSAAAAAVVPAATPTPRAEVPPSTTLAVPPPAPITERAAIPSSAPTPAPVARPRPTPLPSATSIAPATTTLPAAAPTPLPHTPAPAPPPPAHTGPTGTLQLDVDAQQDAYTSGASTLYLKLLVDGRPFRDLSIVFEGRETSRARKHQVFEVGGIPTGRHRITLLASASPDVEKDRPEGITEVEVGPGATRAIVQIRYNAVRFREK